jgi:hypothetical protein
MSIKPLPSTLAWKSNAKKTGGRGSPCSPRSPRLDLPPLDFPSPDAHRRSSEKVYVDHHCLFDHDRRAEAEVKEEEMEWDQHSNAVTLSDDGLSATLTETTGLRELVTAAEELTEINGNLHNSGISAKGSSPAPDSRNSPRHYWEVEILGTRSGEIAVGVAQQGVDLRRPEYRYPSAWCMHGWAMMNVADGALVGSGMAFDAGKSRPTLSDHSFGDERRAFEKGDRVGLQLDLADGSLVFFKNGRRFGPGFPAGSIRGPTVCALILSSKGDTAQLNYIRPNATAPLLSPRPVPKVSPLRFKYTPAWKEATPSPSSTPS